MLFNGRALIFTYSRTQVRIAEHERLQSLFKMSMTRLSPVISQSIAIVKQQSEYYRNSGPIIAILSR